MGWRSTDFDHLPADVPPRPSDEFIARMTLYGRRTNNVRVCATAKEQRETARQALQFGYVDLDAEAKR